MLEERYGDSSAVVQQAKKYFAGWVPLVKVYHLENTSMAGFASRGYIAIRDTQLGTPAAISTLAHELAHTICRHCQ